MSWGVSPWVYPVWDSLGFFDLGDYFLPHFREVFNYYVLKYWSFFLSSSGTPMIWMLGHLTLSQRSLRLSSFLLIHFSFFLSASFISTILSSTPLILSSASVIIHYLFPPECFCFVLFLGFPGGSEVKASACNAGDLGSIPGLGSSPGKGNGNPLQYSCLENPLERGA